MPPAGNKNHLELRANGPQWVYSTAPLVKLDDAHYKLVDQLDALVPAVPSLIACTSLTVKGPVRFATPGVVLKGAVTFTAAGPEPAELAWRRRVHAWMPRVMAVPVPQGARRRGDGGRAAGQSLAHAPRARSESCRERGM